MRKDLWLRIPKFVWDTITFGIDLYNVNNVLKKVSFGSKDCTKELKLECAYFLGQTS